MCICNMICVTRDALFADLILASLPVDGELLADTIRILADDSTEFLERNLTVLVEISLDDSLIDDLLELDVVQVGPYHHLQYLEELTVADEAIAINIINLESDCSITTNKKT